MTVRSPPSDAAPYYRDHAQALLDRYEGVTFETVHADLLAHLPSKPGAALDIGAGSGRDADWLARRGWQVVAVEPSKAFREAGRRLHPDVRIDWIDDALPELDATRLLKRKFDLILLSAVWMHVSPSSEAVAFAALAELSAPEGIVAISVRMGGDDEKRGFYATNVGRLKQTAFQNGFTTIWEGTSSDLLGRPTVGWQKIIFRSRSVRHG